MMRSKEEERLAAPPNRERALLMAVEMRIRAGDRVVAGRIRRPAQSAARMVSWVRERSRGDDEETRRPSVRAS